MNNPIVSSEDELLIVVDADDHILGYQSKAICHDGAGLLHRAFSVFLFNDAGDLLLQQRSAQKRLWPLYWSNTVCSHPRPHEQMAHAVSRRTQEEIGLKANLQFVYQFIYQAHFETVGSEYELCSVYIGCANAVPSTNTNEIAATRYIQPQQLDDIVANPSTPYTPWLRLEWARLRQDYWHHVTAMF